MSSYFFLYYIMEKVPRLAKKSQDWKCDTFLSFEKKIFDNDRTIRHLYCFRCSFCQSYEIKSPPWTILWFRILGIFSVENIARLGVLCFKLQTIVSSALIHSTLLSSWLLSQVWNIKTHNLFIFSTEKITRILNHKMVQGGDLIS